MGNFTRPYRKPHVFTIILLILAQNYDVLSSLLFYLIIENIIFVFLKIICIFNVLVPGSTDLRNSLQIKIILTISPNNIVYPELYGRFIGSHAPMRIFFSYSSFHPYLGITEVGGIVHLLLRAP